jgi:hypothetical protein
LPDPMKPIRKMGAAGSEGARGAGGDSMSGQIYPKIPTDRPNGRTTERANDRTDERAKRVWSGGSGGRNE